MLGCAHPNHSIQSYSTIGCEEVRLLLKNMQAGSHIVLVDEEYILPTEYWVKENFTTGLNKFFFDYGITKWVMNQNDCDKYSLYGVTVANILNLHNPSNFRMGIAVGEVQYIHGFFGHSQNFVIVADQTKKPKVIFYDAQSLKINTFDTNDVWILRWKM